MPEQLAALSAACTTTAAGLGWLAETSQLSGPEPIRVGGGMAARTPALCGVHSWQSEVAVAHTHHTVSHTEWKGSCITAN